MTSGAVHGPAKDTAPQIHMSRKIVSRVVIAVRKEEEVVEVSSAFTIILLLILELILSELMELLSL